MVHICSRAGGGVTLFPHMMNREKKDKCQVSQSVFVSTGLTGMVREKEHKLGATELTLGVELA